MVFVCECLIKPELQLLCFHRNKAERISGEGEGSPEDLNPGQRHPTRVRNSTDAFFYSSVV